LYPYPDLGGNCTIGWGHVLPNDGNGCSGWPNKTYENGITTQAAQEFFDSDIAKFRLLINRTIEVNLTQAQFDALVSYTFNSGDQTNQPYFVKDIPELINSGDFEAAAKAIRSGPITSGGLESPALVERRQRETDLFLFGIYFP
jgi:GH24 family phage-related lysozyme (muramidase)